LAGLEVDHQLVFGWRLHREVGRLLALEVPGTLLARADEVID
jgi:hypothetical protein